MRYQSAAILLRVALTAFLLAFMLGGCAGEGPGAPGTPSGPTPGNPWPPDDDDPQLERGPLRLEFITKEFASAPVAIANAGDERLFVAERRGVIRVIEAGQLRAEPFLDMSGKVAADEGEKGLLGIAFPPDHDATGRFYVYYTERATGRGTLARYLLSGADRSRADPDSGEVLLRLAENSGWHNGGQLAFGADGYLYWAVGDGTNSRAAQDLRSLRGKLLRLDVSGESGYASPADNPFVAVPAARPEIWASGLRNPWRFSFDAATNRLFVADVGEKSFEEVNVISASEGGVNFGWPCMEGNAPYQQAGCEDASALQAPAFTYAHPAGGGASVTGGYVYRGSNAPDLVGAYVFGDFVTGNLGYAHASEGWRIHELSTGLSLNPVTFGEGANGSIYVADFAEWGLYELTQLTE